METKFVHPLTIKKGDKVIRNKRIATVKKIGSCKPETVHVDHECYDVRFGMGVEVPA